MLPVPRVMGSGVSEMLLTLRSICALTVVLAAALLFALLESASLEVAEAVALSVPPAVGVTATESVRLLNPGIEVQVQVRVWETALQAPLKFAEYVPMVDDAGALKVRVTFEAVLPLLL